jgi:hypothetical protein
MTGTFKKISHKYGANRKEAAQKARKHDSNFAQSREVREDRGAQQARTALPRRGVD